MLSLKAKIVGAILIIGVGVAFLAYVTHLRTKNKELQNTVDIQRAQIEIQIQRAVNLENVLAEREQEIQAHEQRQEERSHAVTQAKQNEDFRTWFDTPLPANTDSLLKY